MLTQVIKYTSKFSKNLNGYIMHIVRTIKLRNFMVLKIINNILLVIS